MKRYRVLRMDFDATANLLAIEIKPEWEESVRAQHAENQRRIQQSLAARYGPAGFDQKLRNLLDIGAAPFSLIAFHNDFLRQIRDAFIVGAYYPALTASCALGERLLNQLILTLRDDFAATPEYKLVHGKDSFDKWDQAIRVLDAWAVLLPATVDDFHKLRVVRNRSVHFNPSTDRNVRAEALAAVGLIQSIVSGQFASFGPQPWFIPNDMGLSFVRKSHEAAPFVKRIVLPNCSLVGPAHDLDLTSDGRWRVVDPTTYPETEIEDDEFLRQMKAQRVRASSDEGPSGGNAVTPPATPLPPPSAAD